MNSSRLDFETLTTAQPPTQGSNTVGKCGDSNTDTITVTSPTGANPPVVCGTLSGQHSKARVSDNKSSVEFLTRY